MKTITFILSLMTAVLGAHGQAEPYDHAFNYSIKQKDTTAALVHLCAKLSSVEPARSSTIAIMGTNNQIYEWLFKFGNKRSELRTGAAYMKRVIELRPEQYSGDKHMRANFMDTYANLLYKLGKTKMALAWETRALEEGAKDQQHEFSENLEKMKKGSKTW